MGDSSGTDTDVVVLQLQQQKEQRDSRERHQSPPRQATQQVAQETGEVDHIVMSDAPSGALAASGGANSPDTYASKLNPRGDGSVTINPILLEPDLISTLFGEMSQIETEAKKNHKNPHLWFKGSLRPVRTYADAACRSLKTGLLLLVLCASTGLMMDLQFSTSDEYYHLPSWLIVWACACPLLLVRARLGPVHNHARLDRILYLYIMIVFHVYILFEVPYRRP